MRKAAKIFISSGKRFVSPSWIVQVKEVEAALATTRRTTRSRKIFWFLTKIAIVLCFCQVWQAEKGERGRGWQQLAGSKVKGGLIYSTGQLIVEMENFLSFQFIK